MKIALVTDSYLPSVDGVSHMTAGLAKELSKKHEVMVLTMGDETKTESGDWEVRRLKGACLKAYPQYRYRIRLPTGWVSNEFKNFKPDIVHVQTPMTMGAAAEAAARKAHIPMVSTFHTAIIEFIHEMIQEGNLDVNRITKSVMNFSLVKRLLSKTVELGSYPAYYSFFAASDAVTSPSDAITNTLLSKGISASKIHKVPNFIELNPPRESASYFRDKWGIDGFMALHVGRLSWEKRIHKVLETASHVKDATFVITSKGPLDAELRKKAREMGLDNVIFTGYLPYKELYAAYDACDTFFATSPYETFNISAAQALAFGKPIVGLAEMGLKDFIKHESNGLLTRLNNGEVKDYTTYFKRLMEEPTLKRKLGRNSKRRAGDYEKGKIVQKFVDVYNSAEPNGADRWKYVYALTLFFMLARAMRV